MEVVKSTLFTGKSMDALPVSSGSADYIKGVITIDEQTSWQVEGKSARIWMFWNEKNDAGIS